MFVLLYFGNIIICLSVISGKLFSKINWISTNKSYNRSWATVITDISMMGSQLIFWCSSAFIQKYLILILNPQCWKFNSQLTSFIYFQFLTKLFYLKYNLLLKHDVGDILLRNCFSWKTMHNSLLPATVNTVSKGLNEGCFVKTLKIYSFESLCAFIVGRHSVAQRNN